MSVQDQGSLGAARVAAGKVLKSRGLKIGRSQVEGFVDHVMAGEIVGWAYDRARPNRRVLILAVADGAVIAEALADLPRKDLVNLGKGDGRHGFRLRVPGDLPDHLRRNLRVEAVSQPRNVLLQRGKVELPAHAEMADRARVTGTPEVVAGFIERWSGGELSGWAVDPNNPKASIDVDIFDGEKFLGSVACDRDRPGLAKSGAPAGAKGFSFRVADPGSVSSGANLRVRISGSRFDLRRSKSFPGSPSRNQDVEPLEPDARFEIAEPLSADPLPAEALPPPPVVAPRPRTSGVAILICGEGSAAMVEQTLASCRAQSGAEVEAMRLEPGGLEEQRGGLETLLAARQTVVLLSPGQVANPDLARVVSNSARSFDACTWSTRADGVPDLSPEVAALLGGGFTGAFAVKTAALSQFEGDLAHALCGGDLSAITGWAARSGLRWITLAGRLTEGAVSRASKTPTAPTQVPKRISLAVWGPSNGPALKALLAKCQGLQVEVLASDGASAEDIASLAPGGLESLTVKRVDLPANAGDGVVWRLLSEAATGQAVVLCHGGVRLRQADSLGKICAWATAPRIGAVTLEISGGKRAPLGGLELVSAPDGFRFRSDFDEQAAGRSRPVVAASAAFMAISRESLAAVGGFDAERLPDGLADIDLSLRLRRSGRTSVLLAGAGATADEALVAAWSEQEVSPCAAAALSDDLCNLSILSPPAPTGG